MIAVGIRLLLNYDIVDNWLKTTELLSYSKSSIHCYWSLLVYFESLK